MKNAEKLEGCHPDLIRVLKWVDKIIPIIIICGVRDKEEQNAAYTTGASKLKYPDSNHNITPARPKATAADIAPDPIPYNWGDLPKEPHKCEKNKLYAIFKQRARYYYLAGIVFAVSFIFKMFFLIRHRVVWGGDWDEDQSFADNKFDDLLHFELRE